MKVSALFKVNIGYTFRDAIASLEQGKVGVIQAGDINEARLTAIPRVAFTGDRHLLKAGDVLLSARGRSIACTITSDLLPAVAASSVIILRPADGVVNSTFVAQYFNSRTGQAALAKLASGAYIKTLRKQELAELEIPLPGLDTQHTLAKLAETIESQKQLLSLKQELFDHLWNAAVATATKGTLS
jgi:restriction endonuclease S subunit